MRSGGRARLRSLLAAVGLAAAVLPVAGGVGGDVATVEAANDSPIVALVLKGTGNGHGRGLSQWGAYGYAVDHGWTSSQILDHYYGGTVSSRTTPGQRIRVRLSGYDGLGTVGVVSHGSGVRWNGVTAPAMYARETSAGVFDVFRADRISCPSATSLTVPDGPVLKNGTTYDPQAEPVQRFLKTFQDSSIVVDGYFGPQTESTLAAWQRSRGLPVDGARWDGDDAAAARAQISSTSGSVTWTKIGTHAQRTGSPVRFTSADMDGSGTDRGAVLGICSSSGSVGHYRGAVEVLHTSSGNRVVNDVTVENYLRGVVPKEIAASWAAAGGGAGRHAVQAQAVAARSYGLAQNRSYTYDGSSTRYATTCDTPSCQVYGGAARRSSVNASTTRVEQDLTDAAIAATADVVRTWPSSGAIVSTEFSASNGPRTAGGAFPAVDDIGDDTANNPLHRWTVIIDADDFAARHGLGRITGASMADTTNSSYRGFDGIWFDDLVVTGTNGTFRQQAWDVRNAMGLTSPGFTVEVVRQDTSGDRFALIGDSVGNSIAHEGGSEFRRITDGTFATARIDVVDSRCTTRTACPGTSGVEAAASLERDLDLVVVELGYNDDPASFANDVDAMMATLIERNARRVVWVNMADIRRSGPRSVYGPSNAVLAAAADRYPTLEVLDWDGYSDTPERPRWFSDGVHLTSTGQAEFALWLRDQIVELAPASYLIPPKRLEVPVVGTSLIAPDGTELTVPPDATGVALNVAVFRPSAKGFGTVWPCDGAMPGVANINFERDRNLSNSVIAPIGDDGSVCLYSTVGTDVIVDVSGWFTGSVGPDDASDAPFVGLRPSRRLDTRSGTGGVGVALSPNVPVAITVGGARAELPDGTAVTVPTDVAAVALNVAAVAPRAKGFVTVWPCGTERPTAANVNFERFGTVSNGVVAPVGGDGRVCFASDVATDLVVDLNGWFAGRSDAGSEAAFRSAVPTRLVDTRSGAGGRSGRISSGSPLRLRVAGAALTDPDDPSSTIRVPSSASAVALNLAVVQPTGKGFGTVWPCNEPMPNSANINFRRGVNLSNGVIAPIGPDGDVCVFVSADAHVVVDVAGWFRGDADPSFVGAVPERVVDTRYALGPIPS